jgi:hypothetical protein
MRNEETLRKQKQREMSAVLREQMKEIEERRKRDKEEDLKYLQAVHEDLKKFSVEGEELLQKQKDKYEKNRNIWTQQVTHPLSHSLSFCCPLSCCPLPHLPSLPSSLCAGSWRIRKKLSGVIKRNSRQLSKKS